MVTVESVGGKWFVRQWSKYARDNKGAWIVTFGPFANKIDAVCAISGEREFANMPELEPYRTLVEADRLSARCDSALYFSGLGPRPAWLDLAVALVPEMRKHAQNKIGGEN